MADDSRAAQIMRSHLGERDLVYVFPSEVAADWTLQRLLTESGGRTISRRTCISWDRFKEETLAPPSGARPATRITRALFLSALLEENARRPVFQSLIRPEFASASPAHLASLSRLLPLCVHIDDLLARSGGALDPGKTADLALLSERYRRFLKENRLFEPGGRDPAFDARGRRYIIFYPALIADWDDLPDAVRSHPAVSTCEIEPSAPARAPELTIYPDEETEINRTMLAVHSLLEAGAPASAIAVTAAGLDSLRHALEAGARRYDIRLILNEGKPLLAYPLVNSLGQAAAVTGSDFGLRELALLLGNRSLPWRDGLPANALIAFGRENNCLRNYAGAEGEVDLWERAFSRALSSGRPVGAVRAFYRSLSSGLRGLEQARTCPDVKKAVTRFRAIFWDEARVNEAETRCFDLALRALDEMGEQSLGLGAPSSPFRLWLEILKDIRYVPPSHDTGVAVYPYRVSAGIHPGHHFIIGADEEATRVVIHPFPFLSQDEEARLNLVERDASEDFLALYLASGENVTVSCAEQRFGRVRLPPSFFVKRKSLKEAVPADESADAYAAEKAFFLASGSRPAALFSLQQEGLAAAAAGTPVPAARLFTESGLDRDTLERVLESFTDKAGNIALSPSDLEAFLACPFGLLLSKAAGLAAPDEGFAQDNNKWYGILVHRVFERFFRRLLEQGVPFRAAELDRRTRELEESFEEETARWEREEAAPLPPLWRSIREKLAPEFAAFAGRAAEEYDEFSVAGVERKLSFAWERERVVLTGKIDLIGRTGEGFVLIDFKSGKAPAQSASDPEKGEPSDYQLACYVLLAEANLGPVDGASYYSLKEEGFQHLLKPGPGRAARDEERLRAMVGHARDKILAAAERIRAGDFRLAPAPAGGCGDCSLRPVCRRNYSLRLE